MTENKVNPLAKATLLISSTLITMGDAIVMPLQYAIKQTFKDMPNIDLLASYVLVFNALFIAIGATVVGMVIERFNKKTLLLLSFVIYGVAGTSGLYLNDIYLLITARAFMGISIAGIMTILFTLIGDYFEGDARSSFMGIINGVSLWSGVAFLYIVAPLAAKSWHHPFALYGLAFLLIPLVIISLQDKKAAPVGEKEEVAAEVPPAQTTYPKSLLILIYATAFVAIALLSLTFTNLGDMIAVFSKDIYYIVTGFAVFLASGAIGSMFLYGPVKKVLHHQLIYMLIFALIGSGFLIVSTAGSYSLLLVGVVLSGLGYGFVGPNTTLWIMALVPPALIGRFMGFFTSLLFFAIFVSPNITALALKYMEVPRAFFVYGIVLLALATILGAHGLSLSKKEKMTKMEV